MARANTTKLKSAFERTYPVRANWKSVVENESECYHCSQGHPMLSAIAHYRKSFTDEFKRNDTEFFPLQDGKQTFSTSGKLISKRLSDDLPEGFTTGVNTGPMFCGLVVFADHAVGLVVTPTGLDTTQLHCEWYVHEDAVEGMDYSVDSLIEIFDRTNVEDIEFSERNYRGIPSMRHVPGPIHPFREPAVQQFVEEYLASMAD